MKQVTRSLLSLAAFALVGGGVALFAWLGAGGDKEHAASDDDALIGIDVQRIARFDVSEGASSFRVEKVAGGWDVATPVRIAADPEKVDEVLKALARLRAKRRFSVDDLPPTDDEMGLDDKAAALVAWTDDEPPRRLHLSIGGASEFNHQEYARFTPPDDAAVVVMLAAGARRSVIRAPEQLYDRRVLGARAEQVMKLRVEPSAPGEGRIAFTLERSPDALADAGFKASEPFDGEVDLMAVRRLFEGLGGAPVAEFLTLDAGGELAPYGLDKPAFTVTAWIAPELSSQGELVERKLLVGAPGATPSSPGQPDQPGDGRVRVARLDQPWVGVVHAVLFHALPQGLDDLKSKRVTAVDRAKVTRIELDLKSGEHMALERSSASGPDAWRVLAPEPGKAKIQAVSSFLLTIGTLTGVARELEGDDAKSAAKLKALGLDDGAQRVRMLDESGAALAAIRIGAERGDDVFVMREGADFVVRVPRRRLEDLPEQAAELLE